MQSQKEVLYEGREREGEAKRPVINQAPSTCHLSSLPCVLSLSRLPPLNNSPSPSSPCFVLSPSPFLYCKQPFHILWVVVRCLMLLRGGSPGTMPSIKERWIHAGAKHDLVFLIHLNSVASAPCHQPLNFLVGAGPLMPA